MNLPPLGSAPALSPGPRPLVQLQGVTPKTIKNWGVCLAAILVAGAWALIASAYETYSTNGTTGNCASCHGDFRARNYVSNTSDDPAPWNDDLMSGHLQVGISCAECHSPSGRSPVYLNPASDPAGDSDGLGCVGCHGRTQDVTANDGVFGGAGPNWGDGLRAHHAQAGISTCAGCHDADSVQVGEHVPPQTFAALVIDPCNEDGGDLTRTGRIGNVGLDNDGDGMREPVDSDCQANQSPVADPGGPYTGQVGESVQFDGSGSTDDGTIETYSWNFGDGTGLGTGVTPTHTYGAEGTYDVSLTVTDDGGLTDTANTTATISGVSNTAPVAVADGYSTDEDVPLNVAAPGVLGNDTDADGDALTAVLDGGVSNGSLTLNADGSFSYTPNANYHGSDAFSYHANDGQADSDVVTVTITVNDVNDAPVADAGGPYTGSAGVALSFDGSGSSDVDGTIAAYAWDFGDGSTGTGVSPSHTYAAAGQYTVTLTVTDDDGDSDSDTSTAEIGTVVADADADGVLDDADMCPGTQIPEDVPLRVLRPNHYALVDDDLVFDMGSVAPTSDVSRKNRADARDARAQMQQASQTRTFTTQDTSGCSCSQILQARGLGTGLSKYGCSAGVIRSWIGQVVRRQ